MLEGIIGLNPTRSKQQIEELNSNLSSIQSVFIKNSQGYLSNIKTFWYSPKAVEFSQSIVKSLQEIEEELKKLTIDIVEDACGAFNALAIAHGSMKIEVVPGPFAKGEYVLCEQMDPSGNIGMRINDVKTCTQDYISQLEKLNIVLQDIPKDISFYDNEGNLAGLFNTRVDTVKTLINDSINYINRELAQSISEQIELTQQSAASSRDILSEN